MLQKILTGMNLGESPFWNKRTEDYLWVDILEKKLYIYSSEEECVRKVVVYKEYPSFIFQDVENNLYITFETCICKLDENYEIKEQIIKLEDDGFRCNDGGISPSGELYIGRINNLYNNLEKKFEPDGKLLFIKKNKKRDVLKNITIPNGICWKNKDSVYYNDSFSKKIKEYTLLDGEFKYVKDIYAFQNGFPDGMDIDENNCLWVALYGDGKIIKLDPQKKEILQEFQFNQKNITSCCFVGENLDQLLVTSAKDENNQGSIFILSNLEVKGKVKNKFNGDEKMDFENKYKDSTLCEHFFENNENYYGAVTPPIIQTTLFTFKTFENFIEASTNERENYLYTRGVNPTTEILEKKLAALEKGERAKVFGSGMAAISATLFSLLKSGDHVLLINNVYGPATNYTILLNKYGVESDNIFIAQAKDIEKYIKPNTKVIYYESPSTQLMEMLDIEIIASLGKKYNILTMTDNTWATPFYHKPLTFGIDISVHSCTKYIGGHSDVMGGVVISRNEIIDKIFEQGHQFQGAVIGPQESWLLIRGLRTLPARLEYQKNSTKQIVEFLSKHKNVKKINHPLCFQGQQKDLAEKYLTGFTSLLSFELISDKFEDICRVVNACKLFQIGVSWGGFESLILPQNNGKNNEYLEKYKIPKGLIRLYIGLEDPADLIEDLEKALNQI
ncbi:MAG: PLP-dependent transferase [Cetobacterium sp.]|uniref:PLP-dependent transferase n=1 Tax=Cetobacterium sp. TaxID=2071632 RepID=UPI003EE4791E